jgi:hypothetical protein
LPSKVIKYTLRTERDTLEKLRYIADNNFRTINKELNVLIGQHIEKFENSYGKITTISK